MWKRLVVASLLALALIYSSSHGSRAAVVPSVATTSDFDGDGKWDATVFKPSDGTWYVLQGGNGFQSAFSVTWGAVGTGTSTDIPVPGDYDGDGRVDIAVYHLADGTWYILQGGTGYTTAFSVRWGDAEGGSSTDIPVPGDYDGDGRLDIAVFHPGDGTWYVLQGGNGFRSAFSVTWGEPTGADRPVSGDYDGDGRLDLALYKPTEGMWYVLQGGNGYRSAFRVEWGQPTIARRIDTSAAGNPAVITAVGLHGLLSSPELVFIEGHTGTIPSINGVQTVTVLSDATFSVPLNVSRGGTGGTVSTLFDMAVPGDYDGDGRIDLGRWRPSEGVWYILQAASGFTTAYSVSWGSAGVEPVPGDFDNDGRLDVATFHPTEGTWYVLQGGNGYSSAFSLAWGAVGDVPVSLRNPVK